MKSCYRPVFPALPTTAWIGETRWLLVFSSWEPQASCLPPSQAPFPKGLPGLVQAWAWACQSISGQPPGWGPEKGAGPLASPSLAFCYPFLSCPHCSSNKSISPVPLPLYCLAFFGRFLWKAGGVELRGLGWSLKG